jgi:hypothetical protein
MRLAEDIKRIIKNARIIINPEIKKDALKELINELKKLKTIGPTTTKPTIWRVIIKSPLTKIATAAAIIIACSTGLILWKGTGSGIALANVLTRIEQIAGYTYQVSTTTTRQKLTGTRMYTVLVSKEHGIKMTIAQADPNSQPKYEKGDEWYLLTQSNSIVIVSHKKKTYDKFVYDGVKLSFYKEQYNEPRAIIKQILSCEHKSLGQSVIDGIAVEGFQTTDLAYGGGFFGEAARAQEPKKVDVRVWVDVKTFLPVLLEEDIDTKKGTRMHEVSYDFQWNVIINPDDFDPHIPTDYRAPVGDIIIRPPNEENAIKGLRLFADNFGKYPASLEKKAFGEEFKRLMPSDPNSYEELSDEERTRKTNEWLSLSAPSLFYRYRKLANKNMDHAYHGETVKPGDADKVLLRWKMGDGQYRVIFGNLRAKTVTDEELVELEKP